MFRVLRCPHKVILEGFSQNMGNDFVKTRLPNSGTAKFCELNSVVGSGGRFDRNVTLNRATYGFQMD